VDNSRNHTLLQTKLSELGHANVQLKFIKAETPAAPFPITVSAPTPANAQPKVAGPGPARSAIPEVSTTRLAPFDKDSFKNDPLIQKALEIFKGQIVEVRA
jgi:hypothetical protein